MVVTVETNPINIGNINDGAMIDNFDLALKKVLDNIADLTTPATRERSLTLKVTFKPAGDRITIDTTVSCAVSLAPVEAHQAKVFLGKPTDGATVAYSADPRQMPLWERPKPAETVIQFGTINK